MYRMRYISIAQVLAAGLAADHSLAKRACSVRQPRSAREVAQRSETIQPLSVRAVV